MFNWKQWLLDRFDVSTINENVRRRGWTPVPPQVYKFPDRPVFPTKPLVFDDRSLSHLGPHNQVCWGCNKDDRGFVVVNGCPQHDPRPVARRVHGDGVTGD